MALFSLWSHGKTRAVVDFNYPKDVSKTAIADLNSALKSGNGELVVDALVRFSVAQSGISQETMPAIVSRIDSAINLEKDPKIKALLYYLEAEVFEGYRNHYSRRDRINPTEDSIPKDYTEWDRAQFNAKIDQLIGQSLSQPDALKATAVTSMPDIITCDKMGATYIPTLFEFLCMKGHELSTDEAQKKAIVAKWKASTENNTPAHIYVLNRYREGISPEELYSKYRDNEHSGMILNDFYGKNAYVFCKEYAARFPNGFYTPDVRNKINGFEATDVTLYCEEYASAKDRPKVKINGNNVNDLNIIVYRIPDDYTSRNNRNSSVTVDKLKVVRTIPFHIEGTVPFSFGDTSIVLDPLPYGQYIITPSYKAGGKTVQKASFSTYQTLTVTDIMMFNVAEAQLLDMPEKSACINRVFALDSETGAPKTGVEVKGEKVSGVTTKDGFIVVPETVVRESFVANLDADRYGPSMGYYKKDANGLSQRSCKLFTDLGIYRPGEKVKWALVYYTTNINKRQIQSDANLRVVFQDANGKKITSVDGKTDDFGRLEGEFEIPTDRLNGNFRIIVYCGSDRDIWLNSTYVNVSEYKTPTFEVTFPDAKWSYTKDSPVKITGKAETYSGMPVANAEVKLQLRKKEWSWWWRYSSRDKGNMLQDTVVTTDKDGKFTIEFPASLFVENVNNYRWAYFNYSLHAACTDGAGETQENAHAFIVGERAGLELNSTITHLNTEPLTLPLIYNTTSEFIKSVDCEWALYKLNGKDVVASGTFNSAKPVIDLTKLESGQYSLSVNIKGETEESEKKQATVTLYRKNDKQAPVENTSLWLPDGSNQYYVDKNNVAHISIGTSTPEAHIYYVAQSRNRIVDEGWLHYKPGMHELTIAIPREREEYISVELLSAHDKVFTNKRLHITAPDYAERLNVKVTSFRDKLVPGDHEHWTIQTVDKNGNPRPGALMLEMFDKAINSLSPNEWSFWVSLPSISLFSTRHESLTGSSYNEVGWRADSHNTNHYELPELYTYDQMFFGYLSYGYTRNAKALGAAAGARPMMSARMDSDDGDVMYAAAVEESAEAEMMVEKERKVASAEVPGADEVLDNIAVRETDVKTALWHPMLTTDEQGNAQLEFDAPQFNTTWLLQIIGFDKDLYSDRYTHEVVTQKPIMVKSSLPRFLRHGDVVTLAANVQNATEQPTQAKAIIELFDPRTGDIYTSSTTNVSLDAKGTQVVNIDWTVPSDIPFVGFRIKAADNTYGDGEQVMVPVLEAVSPVIETQPFYVEAATPHFTTQLPQFAKDARVTLEYCDNPVWYCVTALPTIISDNYEISTRLAHSLFAIEVAQAVAKGQPQIKEAVDYWKSNEQDSTLVSMLAKNQDLKVGTLLASPWLRDADRQTLRMSKLNELFDAQLMAKERTKILEALKKMQQSDGGWPWYVYPNCKSSLWTTETVLELIGETQQLGQLTDNAEVKGMVEKAIKFYDSEYLRIYKEMKKKDYGYFTSYAYVRTLFKDYKMPSANKKIFDNTLKQMSNDWRKGLSLSQKAFFAITLNRNGYQKTAANIMESVRQFAITKPELGMYWDNLQSGWRYFDKVAVTSTILQAFNECDPRKDEIDLIRKWMLLMKQTNDWGSSSLAADAVYSLLTTGSQWLERNPMPEITIGGTPVTYDKIDEYLGYFRKTINAAPGSTVEINRTGNGPAWGAVYCQFRAPMTSIPEVAITELSINKEFYRYNNDGTLSPADHFKVGDKVQVRLVIKNNKDLDYVTVKDERAACFEPVDKLSGHRNADYSWYYLETKDAITNLFFTDLQKGTHVINYDVYVTAPGQFSAGIATAQCQYAAQITAHSAGRSINVK